MVSSSISNASSTMGAASINSTSFNSTSKTNDSTSFDTLMTNSIASSSSGKTKTNSASDNLDKITTKVSDNKNDVKSEVNTKRDTSVDKMSNSQKTEKADNNSDIKDAVNDAKEEIIDELKEEIKKTFGITDEELEKLMSEMGMSFQDLLQPANLTELVAKVTGNEDAMSLLTDSSASDKLKSLMDFMNNKITELSAELNIPEEDLKSMLQEVQTNVNDKVAQENLVSATEVNADTESETDIEVNVTDESDNTMQDVIESKLTTRTETESNISQNNSSNEHMSGKNENTSENNIFTNVSNNLANSVENAFQNIEITETDVKAADIVNQIIEAVKVRSSEAISSMEIQLNPENLGKINLTVTAKNGMITAELATQNEAVRKALENQIVILKENLSNQGIKVDAVEVTIASHNFDGNSNLSKEDSNKESAKKNHSRGLRLDSLNDLSDDELTDEELRIKNLFRDENSSVEYSA